MKPQFHFNCCTYFYYVRWTNMKQEWTKWNFTALIACKILYVHSTMKYKTPPFSLLLLLPLQKSSSVHCQMLNCRTQQSRILFFFMVSIEMVVDFLTSLYIEWRVQSTNVIQCLKSTHIHLHSFSTKTAGSWDVNRLDFKHCRLAIF